MIGPRSAREPWIERDLAWFPNSRRNMTAFVIAPKPDPDAIAPCQRTIHARARYPLC